MIYWAPFLHFYQPPTQFHVVLEKVCNESYRPLVKIFSERPDVKVTINVCGVLTEMLNDHGGIDIIEGIAKLAEAGKLEFVESAKYHAILPLIPPKEIRRQVELNHRTNSYFFKDTYRPRGFFSPEMCYSNELASILSTMGYEWMLAEGAACSTPWPLDVIYRVPLGKNKIIVFYRDDILSNKVSFQNIESDKFISELIDLSKSGNDIYVITAMDAETFGHHIQNWEKLFLAEVYKTLEDQADGYEGLERKTNLAGKHGSILDLDAAGRIKVVTISELLNKFPVKISKPPLPSSWSTTKENIKNKNYYPLWKNPSNPIHQLQWKHVNLCLDLVDTAMDVKDSKESSHFAVISRALADRAMHSCQFWWANRSHMWDVNMVNKGLALQEEVIFNAYKAIFDSACKEDVKEEAHYKLLAARDIANRIRDLLIAA